jgi:hypothetical protein
METAEGDLLCPLSREHPGMGTENSVYNEKNNNNNL